MASRSPAASSCFRRRRRSRAHPRHAQRAGARGGEDSHQDRGASKQGSPDTSALPWSRREIQIEQDQPADTGRPGQKGVHRESRRHNPDPLSARRPQNGHAVPDYRMSPRRAHVDSPGIPSQPAHSPHRTSRILARRSSDPAPPPSRLRRNARPSRPHQTRSTAPARRSGTSRPRPGPEDGEHRRLRPQGTQHPVPWRLRSPHHVARQGRQGQR